MTSRERINIALKHQIPDRTPIFEYVLLSPVADRLLGRKYGADPDNWNELVRDKGWAGAVRQSAVDQLDLACLLGHDLMYVLPNPLPEQMGNGTKIYSPSNSDDPAENVRNRNRFYRENPPVLLEESFLRYEILMEEMANRGIDIPILAPAYEHGVWTDIDLMQTMLLEPETAHEHFSLATGRALKYAEKYMALGIDQVGVGGDFSGNNPLISPKAYREFIVPEVRKVARYVHEHGGYAVNASDGNLWPVIEDFLVGCEVDGYLEIDFFAGMNLKKLKSEFGDKVTFYGNLDCGNVLSFGSVDDVRKHTLACIEDGLGDGGHILCAGNAITGSVPIENYLTVIKTYRDYFNLPALELE